MRRKGHSEKIDPRCAGNNANVSAIVNWQKNDNSCLTLARKCDQSASTSVTMIPGDNQKRNIEEDLAGNGNLSIEHTPDPRKWNLRRRRLHTREVSMLGYTNLRPERNQKETIHPRKNGFDWSHVEPVEQCITQRTKKGPDESSPSLNGIHISA